MKKTLKAQYGKQRFLSNDNPCVGELEFTDDKVSFSGVSKNFIGKATPVRFSIDKSEVAKIELTYPNKVCVTSADSNLHIFSVGFIPRDENNVEIEYKELPSVKAFNGSYTLFSFGRDAKRAKVRHELNESILKELRADLADSQFSNALVPGPSGSRNSKKFGIAAPVLYATALLFWLIVVFALLYFFKVKLPSLK